MLDRFIFALCCFAFCGLIGFVLIGIVIEILKSVFTKF